MDKVGFSSRFKDAVAFAGVDDTQDSLGRLLGVSSVMIWSYRTGEKLPRMSTAIRIAETLGVNVNWLLTGHGEMTSAVSNVEPAPPLRKKGVPLISWVQAGDWCEAVDPYAVGNAELWLPAADNYSKNAYALRVRGASMEPRFREGEIIVINPDGAADSGKFVIARKEGSKDVTFKQLIREGDEAYLKAVNPQWPEPIIRMDEAWHICGVVVCKMEIF